MRGLTGVALQFWKMDEGIYSKGLPPYGTKLSPDFCFGHWQTQCRATYEAPVDPHVVLGGFPNGPSFRNFSADATSFVVTYPVDSSADNRCGFLLGCAGCEWLRSVNLQQDAQALMCRTGHCARTVEGTGCGDYDPEP